MLKAEARPKQKRAPGGCPARGSFRNGVLELFDFAPNVLFRLSEALLYTTVEFVLFAISKGEIVVSELAVLLLQLPFDLVPARPLRSNDVMP